MYRSNSGRKTISLSELISTLRATVEYISQI